MTPTESATSSEIVKAGGSTRFIPEGLRGDPKNFYRRPKEIYIPSLENNDEPWLQLPEETKKAYAAFCILMDMDPVYRSMKKLQRQLGHKNPHTSYLWRQKYGWVRRLEAWDKHLQRVSRAEVERRTQELARERIDAAIKITKRGAKDLDETQRKLTPTEIARLNEVGVKMAATEPKSPRSGGIKLENVLIAVANERRDPRTVTD